MRDQPAARWQGARQLISGITLGTEDVPTRIARGSTLFDDLYRSMQTTPSKPRDSR